MRARTASSVGNASGARKGRYDSMFATALRVAVVAVVGASPALGAGSPWLPAPGGGSLTVSFVSQSAAEFYRAATKRPTPGGGATLAQRTIWLDVTYGIADSVALDFRAGGAKSSFITGPGIPTPEESFGGLTDIEAGIVWRAVDEVVSSAPSIAFRAGVIKAGGYETGYINSLGDGGNGVEVSAMVGKFLKNLFAISGEVGYRYRNNHIPSNIFANLSAGVLVVNRLGLAFNYDVDDARSGLDIGGPGFSPDRFPELQEDIHLVGPVVSLSVTDRVTIGGSYGKVVRGRNTAAASVFSISLGYAFN